MADLEIDSKDDICEDLCRDLWNSSQVQLGEHQLRVPWRTLSGVSEVSREGPLGINPSNF